MSTPRSALSPRRRRRNSLQRLFPEQAVQRVVKGQQRMLPEHTRTGIAHHHAHLFAAVPLVAMNGALGAGGLFSTKPAALQTEVRVIEQPAAFRAWFGLVMVIPAIDVNHGGECLEFPLQPFSRQRR